MDEPGANFVFGARLMGAAMKWIQSPGIKTDMIFHRFDGQVEDRGSYVVVRTPSNPDFYYGNLLIFPEAPQAGSMRVWESLFHDEFRHIPAVRHRAFLWDDPGKGQGDTSELAVARYEVEESVVLFAEAVQLPPKAHPSVEVRPLRAEEEWREATKNQYAAWVEHSHGQDGWAFKESQMHRYRAMVAKGLGQWFGAFLEGKLVADLGIFRDQELGRFQNVSTHPAYRRQGICGSLVFATARFALREMGVGRLVMVADSNYHAAKIYESVGFRPGVREFSAFLPPPA